MYIRRYTNHDHEEVYQLHVKALKQVDAYLGEGPWDNDLNNIEESYINNKGEFLIGEIQGKIIAMGAYKKSNDGFAEIKRMRVDPSFQGNGYGKIILNKLEEKAKEMGYIGFILETSEKQKVAQKLYLNNGFKEVRREVIHNLNCIWFEKRF